jgi:ABC-type branched-subunit amino acid transport system substrate-binding protein
MLRSALRKASLGALLASAVWGAAPATAAIDEIRIGYINDLSTLAAESGNDSLKVLELAVEEANAKGGINGRKVKLIVYDGKADPQLSATYATRLFEDDKALTLVGGDIAQAVGAMIQVANEFKTPFISLSAATDSFTSPSTPFHFRVGPRNSQDAAAVAEVIAKQGFKRVAIINNSLPYGLDGSSAISKALQARGVSVVASETYDINANDLSPQVVKIRDAKPEVVIVWPYPADGGRVLRTLHQLNVKVPRLVARMALYDTLRKIAGDAGDGALVTNTVDPERPEVRDFFARLAKRSGERPATMYIAMTMDAIQIAFAAIATPEVEAALAKSDLPGARVAVKAAIEKMSSFTGLQGRPGAHYSFSPQNHHGSPDQNWFVFLELKGGGLIKADMSKFKP